MVGSHGSSSLKFLRTLHTVFTNSSQGFLFLCVLANTCYFVSILGNKSEVVANILRGAVTPHCSIPGRGKLTLQTTTPRAKADPTDILVCKHLDILCPQNILEAPT